MIQAEPRSSTKQGLLRVWIARGNCNVVIVGIVEKNDSVPRSYHKAMLKQPERELGFFCSRSPGLPISPQIRMRRERHGFSVGGRYYHLTIPCSLLSWGLRRWRQSQCGDLSPFFNKFCMVFSSPPSVHFPKGERRADRMKGWLCITLRRAFVLRLLFPRYSSQLYKSTALCKFWY